MEIRKNGKALDLGTDFSIQIEDTNPVYNELGSQSVPATVPVTRRNIELMDGIHRTDAGVNPNLPEESIDVIDGAYIRRGTLNVTEAGRKEGITFNIGFDNSTAYQKWQQRKLSEMGNLPIRKPGEGGSIFGDLEQVYRGKPATDRWDEYQFDDLAVFPIVVNKDENNGFDYWELINSPDKAGTGLFAPSEVARIIDGTKTIVKVPRDYGISPFLKVWKVIELVFEDLDLTLLNNPFEKDEELARIVVLNNTADTICRNEINYRDLMPDCTVKSFLNALWVRFGLVYNVNFDKKTVDLQLIKNIVKKSPGISLDELATDYEFIRYLTPQYIKLSAETGLEGATPACERFEDYIKGLDVKDVKMGSEIWSWKQKDNGDWDRELYDGYIDDREDPDWDDWDYPDPPDPDWDDRDDDRDDGRDDDRDDDRDYYSTRSENPIMPIAEEDIPRTILAREFVTGRWFKLDTTNGKTKDDSSSFFDWDPQPDGMDPFELSSDDECVPVKKILKMSVTNQDFQIYDYFPLFMVGARHFHSYIIDNEDEETNREETPLAFMIAYTSGGRTIGRLSPETENGVRLALDDGTKPLLTLFFQFADGLFAKFWKDFDEILRHGNREVELPVRMSKVQLNDIDMLLPATINGLRCLIDQASYTLPSDKEVDVDITLRSIQTQGEYDIDAEQNIPDFHVIRTLAWKIKEMDNLRAKYEGSGLEMANTQSDANVTWWNLDDTRGFSPEPGYHAVVKCRENYTWVEGAVSSSDKDTVGIQQISPLPEEDYRLSTPQYVGQRYTRNDYDARFHYDIFEAKDGSNQLKSAPSGKATVDISYKAVLVARFVPD